MKKPRRGYLKKGSNLPKNYALYETQVAMPLHTAGWLKTRDSWSDDDSDEPDKETPKKDTKETQKREDKMRFVTGRYGILEKSNAWYRDRPIKMCLYDECRIVSANTIKTLLEQKQEFHIVFEEANEYGTVVRDIDEQEESQIKVYLREHDGNLNDTDWEYV